MVVYNPKSWFSLIFQFHKSDTFRILFSVMIAISIYTALLVFVQQRYDVVFKSTTVVHSLLGFVISLLLVFRTNTAYERWWEGRRQFGLLVNNSRNFSMKINAFIPESNRDKKELFHVLIHNYVFSMKEHLRKGVKMDELINHPQHDSSQLTNYKHIPNKIASAIFKELNFLYTNKIITGNQLIVLNEEARSLTEIVGACERIRSTPIPYSYSLFLKKFMFVYIMTMPFAFIQDFGYWTALIVVFVFYVLASLELIAEEIEDPFGTDANDLPTDEISLRIKANLEEIFE